MFYIISFAVGSLIGWILDLIGINVVKTPSKYWVVVVLLATVYILGGLTVLTHANCTPL